MSVPEVLDTLPRRFTGWAVGRSLAPASLTGVSLALGVCAAVWFSAGTRPGNLTGSLALCACYLAASAARRLPCAEAAAGAGRIADVGGAVTEYTVYAGLAVGGYAAHWAGTWQLAVMLAIVIALRRTAAAASRSGPGEAEDASPIGRVIRGFLSCPWGGRIALVTLAAPVWGAHATLMTLLEWGVIGLGYAITAHGPYRVMPTPVPEDVVTSATLVEPAIPAAPAMQAGQALPPGKIIAVVPAGSAEPAGSIVSAGSIEAAGCAAPGVSVQPAGSVQPAVPADPGESTTVLDLLVGGADAPPPRNQARKVPVDPRALGRMFLCRDDGSAGIWLGQLVRGQFVPLPPAIAGLAATCFLAWLGMRNLPGVLLLTPLVVLLLGAPGSSHRHDGRLDWLTPAVLLAAQFVYLAALGFSFRVPGPVTYSVCALTALRYADLASRRAADARHIPDTRLGWEGRMLLAGLGAMAGIATAAYLLLAAYLAVTISAKLMTSHFQVPARERR